MGFCLLCTSPGFRCRLAWQPTSPQGPQSLAPEAALPAGLRREKQNCSACFLRAKPATVVGAKHLFSPFPSSLLFPVSRGSPLFLLEPAARLPDPPSLLGIDAQLKRRAEGRQSCALPRSASHTPRRSALSLGWRLGACLQRPTSDSG